MSDFTALQINETISRAFDEGPDPDDIVFEVRPPEESGGVQDSQELMKSFHQLDMESGLLGKKNTSDMGGLEIWYENESFNFVFYVPNENANEHYRRQLAGHFRGLSISELVDRDEKCIMAPEGEYITATRLKLNKHYFEPIGNPIGGGDDDVDQDPYQTILNEADTKDDTRMVIQFLYKPADPDWTSLLGEDVDSYAETLEETGTCNPRLFGLAKDTIDNPQARDAGANEIRGQANKPGFYLEARILIISPEKHRAEQQMDNIVNLFGNTYRSGTEQKFVADHSSNTKRVLADMIQRKPRRMSLPSGLRGWLKTQLHGASKTMVMTIPELAGVVHLPSGDDITVDGINWTDAPVKGTLPPEALTFEPVTPDEVRKKLTREELEQVAESDPDLLCDFDEPVTEAHAQDYNPTIEPPSGSPSAAEEDDDADAMTVDSTEVHDA